jgi:hypothetical protein
MRKLTINWFDLEAAFEVIDENGSFSEISNYFDTQTGEVVTVDELVNDAAEEVFEELDEVFADSAELTDEQIRNTETYQGLDEWLKPHVITAIHVIRGDDLTRFEKIPHFNSRESYQWMAAFVDTVEDDKTRERLSAAINQRSPFRKFRDAIGSDRRLERQWRVFELARQRDTIIAWLKSIDVQPLNPDKSIDLPPLPDLRKIMFAEVRRFVRFARDIRGLHRIALIGSLASVKEFPKDIDLLITISDDCNLSALATLGRQLAGHMAAHSAGADIFLANSDGEYLGRTCPWKQCSPGVRQSCDALSCGVRKYLHDDLMAVRLSKKLIQDPPALLWPEISASSDCPADLHRELIQQLSEDSNR